MAHEQARSAARQQRLRELGLAFHRAYHSLRSLRGRETHLSCGQLGSAQYELLARLHEEGPLAIGALADALSVGPATVSQMVDGLVQAGYVERAHSAEDRRVVVVELTARGRPLIAAKRAAWRRRWADRLAEVSDEELEIATAVLAKVGLVFDEADDA
ncbi:MAG TPA: MarR family transcriptional regulator [Solirubrobacterales bacterium]|nr:MarR family transcriptional regulator [Solirubrobacterales bacterium]